MVTLKHPVKFIWDKGNQNKNWLKHHVTAEEAEQAFFDPHKQKYPDPIHSTQEKRRIMIGKTKKDRLLFIAYTIRNSYIRVISARNLNTKERPLYEKAA